MPQAPVICICHGGGPLPLLDDPSHAQLTSSLRNRVPRLLHIGTDHEPRAIVVISAHWESTYPSVSSPESPSLMYDYTGFPPEAYEIKYDAPGSPEVAKEVFSALEAAGLQPKMENDRAWDHGVFVPLALINPHAHIPIIQLSILSSEAPSALFATGRAISHLRAQNIAILGSGSASFHNLRAMFSGVTATAAFQDKAHAFSQKLDQVVDVASPAERKTYLEGWRAWPGSYGMHPRGRSEHFSPLLVCAGAAGEGLGGKWVDEFAGFDVSGYYWL